MIGRVALVLVLVCGAAAAAPADRADQLFKKGKKLLADRKYAEACTAFEQSDKLDPAIGVKLNIAKCYEEWGKLATAWHWYSEAERMATEARDDRAPKIHALIAELDPKVPRLTLRLPRGAATDGVVIKLDGVEVPAAEIGSERRVDPGPHQIDAIVDGAPRSKTVPVERGSTDVVLDVPVRSGRRGAVTATETADPGHQRRLIGLGVSGGGVALVAIAGIVTLRARSDYRHALSAHCHGATDMCDDIGQTDTHSARRRANISTAVAIGGLAAIGAGIYLYVTTPRRERAEHAMYLAPSVDGGPGVVLGGAF